MQFMVASGQYMQFLDMDNRVAVPVDANELEPNHRYAVLLFLQNNEPVGYENVNVTVWHDTFEVGVRGLASLILQPAPVEIPPRVKDAQGRCGHDSLRLHGAIGWTRPPGREDFAIGTNHRAAREYSHERRFAVCG